MKSSQFTNPPYANIDGFQNSDLATIWQALTGGSPSGSASGTLNKLMLGDGNQDDDSVFFDNINATKSGVFRVGYGTGFKGISILRDDSNLGTMQISVPTVNPGINSLKSVFKTGAGASVFIDAAAESVFIDTQGSTQKDPNNNTLFATNTVKVHEAVYTTAAQLEADIITSTGLLTIKTIRRIDINFITVLGTLKAVWIFELSSI